MAVPIGNLIRGIDHVLRHEKTDKAFALQNEMIRKAFDDLQPYVHDAERKRDLHNRKWRRPNKIDYKKLRVYRKIAKWVSHAADLAREVYDIFVSYTWHIGNTKESFSCINLFIPRLISINIGDVSEKIKRFLDPISQSQSSSGGQNQSSLNESPSFYNWQSMKEDKSSHEKFPLLAESSQGHSSEESLTKSTSFTSSKYPEVQRSQHQSSWNTHSWFSNIITLKANNRAPYTGTQRQTLVTGAIYKWRKLVLGMDLAQLYERFSIEVIKRVEVLIQEAMTMHIQSDRESLLEPNALKTPMVSILESRKINVRAEEQTQIEHWLRNAYEASNNVVIGITGTGSGTGKTALAHVVYERMQRYYDCHAWVHASPVHKRSLLEDVLKGILKSTSVMVPDDMDTIDEATLKEMIKRMLTKNMFLLILDEIQEPEILEDVMDTLPKDCKVNIICTSQKHLSKCTQVLHLMGLNFENSLNLFKRHVTVRQEHLPTSWWDVTEEALGTLKGNPFAITTIGGMQSTMQRNARRWMKINTWLKDIHFIPLSYADLRPLLKSCFLYAASFPSHMEISCKKLQRLWIAEGFVEVGGNTTLEEAAKLQLDELIQRNMIHVAQVSPDGCVKTCLLLEPMRNFALGRSQEDQFCIISDNKGSHAFPKTIHRLFLHEEGKISQGVNCDKLNLSQLYSFLAFKGNGEQQHFVGVFRCRHLSVLELQQVPSNNLPDAIGDLSMLRYLGLRGTKITKVPISLKKLKRLQTLDIRNTFVRDLPDNLDGLTVLRHLLLAGSFSDNVVNLNAGIEVFKDLRTLSGIKLTESVLKGLSHLPQLQKLSVGSVKKSHSDYLFKSVERMKFLRSLTIKCSLMEKMDLITCKPHDNLEKIRLGGCAKNAIAWVSKVHALKHLYLWDSKLPEDPFPALEQLPSLFVLSLCNAYDGETIRFSPRGFPSLKKLAILHCRRLKRCTEIGDGAMEKLQTLVIAYCPKLSKLPEGMDKLTSLEALHVSNMSENFINEARKTHLTLGKQFSLHIQNPSQFPTPAQDTKRLPDFMPSQRSEKMKTVVEPVEAPASSEDVQILGEKLNINYFVR